MARSSKRKPNFNVGQVVAECYDFKDGKGEFIKDFVQIGEGMVAIFETEYETPTRRHYFRPLTKRERGPSAPPARAAKETP